MRSEQDGGAPRIIVAGDAILDRYLAVADAGPDRKSEVMTLRMRGTTASAGGAANAAVNISVMGAQCELLAPIGDDAAGTELRQILADHGVRTPVVTPGIGSTVVKTRMFRGHEQIMRLDAEPDDRDRSALDLTRHLDHTAAALLISDYGYGALADPVADDGGGRWPPIVVVDARRLERWRPVRPTVVSCDAAQAARICGSGPITADEAGSAAAADLLIGATGAEAVVITLGSRGAVLLRSGHPALSVAPPRVVDGSVAGSGDVFAAALTVGLAGGLGISSAVREAVTAATRATVEALAGTHTAVASPAPDRTPTRSHVDPIPMAETGRDLTVARIWADRQRRRGARIVMAGGCFDLLHEGHVALLARAAELGDVLVVAVNDDDGVRALKGSDRPIVDLEGRLRVLRALECVDLAVPFAGTSPAAMIEALSPHVFVKGADYSEENLPEAPLLRRLGVEIHFLDLVPNRSTTRLVERAGAASGREG